MGRKLGEGATGIVYAVDLRSPTTIDLPPRLCIKIAKPPFAGALAREAWFYEQLQKEGLDGVVTPSCFGLNVLDHELGRASFHPWRDMEECRDHSFELRDDPSHSRPPGIYYDGPGVDFRYKSPWMDWEFDPENPLIAVLLLERMEDVYKPMSGEAGRDQLE